MFLDGDWASSVRSGCVSAPRISERTGVVVSPSSSLFRFPGFFGAWVLREGLSQKSATEEEEEEQGTNGRCRCRPPMMKRGRRSGVIRKKLGTQSPLLEYFGQQNPPLRFPASLVSNGRMLQFPAFMRQMTSPPLIPTSTLFPVAAHAQNDVEALAILEAELEDKLSKIRKGNSNRTVIGKKVVDSKEELEAGAEDDEVDNAGDSEGDEFEQETG